MDRKFMFMRTTSASALYSQYLCWLACDQVTICIYVKVNFSNDYFLAIVTVYQYAKVHGSVSVDALQRKEPEESACGKVHDPELTITKIYFHE